MELKKVYLAIPYSKMEESSYHQATEATTLIINSQDINVFSPITHSHPLTKFGARGDWEYWQHIDYQFLDWADEMWVLVPKEGFIKVAQSTGVNAEMRYARKKGMEIKMIEVKDGKILDYGRVVEVLSEEG